MIALDDKPSHAGGVMARETPAGLVLFTLPSGRHARGYSLNGIGSRVWVLCDGTRTVREIIWLICSEYDAPEGRVTMDVLALLCELAAERLVDLGGVPAPSRG